MCSTQPEAGTVWHDADLAQLYLDVVRAAIPFATEQLDLLHRLLATRDRPVLRFLDVGCGDGTLGLTLLDQNPDAEGWFVDFSPPMLGACRRRLASYGDRGHVAEADLSDPAWWCALRDRPAFDAVVSRYAIHHLPDARKRELYGELHALLAPGGWFVHLEHVAPACATTRRLFDDAFVDRITELLAERGRPLAREEVLHRFVDRPDRTENRLVPVEEQCRWLQEIGFREVDCYFKLHELAVFGGRKAG